MGKTSVVSGLNMSIQYSNLYCTKCFYVQNVPNLLTARALPQPPDPLAGFMGGVKVEKERD